MLSVSTDPRCPAGVYVSMLQSCPDALSLIVETCYARRLICVAFPTGVDIPPFLFAVKDWLNYIGVAVPGVLVGAEQFLALIYLDASLPPHNFIDAIVIYVRNCACMASPGAGL
jgi:hypothetical protein